MMSMINALKPFKKRLTREALLKSALLSGVIASCVALLPGLIRLIFPWMISKLWIVIIFVGALLASFILIFLIIYRPSLRDTARRIDGLGLSERVETMLEYQDSTAPAAMLQRSDALNYLKTVKTKDICYRISKPIAVMCAAFFVSATVLLFLPEVNAFGSHPLIQAMRDLVSAGDISDELRDELEDIIEDLAEQLKEGSEEGDGEALQEAGDRISEAVDGEVSKNEIGKALQGFKDLEELGAAIEKGDKEGVSAALDKLEEKLQNNASLREEIAEQLQMALSLSGTSEENNLYLALDHMSENLQNTEHPLDETMQQAESEIHEALDQQAAAHQLGEQLKELLENAKPSDSSEEGEEQDGNGQEGSGQEGEQGKDETEQGNQQGGSSGDSQNSGQVGPGNGSGGDSGMNDKIQDPEKGQVNYGNVYAGYFAEFLSQAEAGKLPDSVVEAMNEYLENLKNGKGD